MDVAFNIQRLRDLLLRLQKWANLEVRGVYCRSCDAVLPNHNSDCWVKELDYATRSVLLVDQMSDAAFLKVCESRGMVWYEDGNGQIVIKSGRSINAMGDIIPFKHIWGD